MSGRISRIILSALALVMLMFVLPFSAQADGGEDAFTQTVNGYQMALVFAEKPALGENQIHVQIYDMTDMPISDARVEVSLALAEEENHGVAQGLSSHDNMAGIDEHASEASGHDVMSDASDTMSLIVIWAFQNGYTWRGLPCSPPRRPISWRSWQGYCPSFPHVCCPSCLPILGT